MKSPTYIERVERKYELAISEDSLPALRRDISRYVPTHEFTPGQAVTINNTIYFDNDDFHFLRSGLANKSDHTRIRARKYEYDSASFDGLAYYWVELRIKRGEISRKQRLKLEKGDLQKFLEGREIDEAALDYNQSQADSEQCKNLYEEIQNIVLSHSLKPILLVTHNRVAFEQGSVRITLDWDIRYYQAEASISHYENLKDLPDQPCGRETSMILELKYSGESPSWFSELRQRHPIHSRRFFSKLDSGMKALLQGPFKSHEDSEALLKMIDDYREKEEQEHLFASA